MSFRVRMTPRDLAEDHRASTPLELFFDLVFVIAVAQASSGLHHGVVEGHWGSAVVSYLAVFFAIWWAWMNFTWFASAYDTDDDAYRITVFVVMVGALVLAAGVSDYAEGERNGVILGYVVMRVAMVALWVRAAIGSPEGRASALRYAVGIAVLQVLWVIRLLVGDPLGPGSFLLLAAAELALPYWAERAGPTAWHPRHIAERYSLFTLIVLGEALLAATQGVHSVLGADTGVSELLPTIVGGLLLVFSMWWIYFALPNVSVIAAVRQGAYGGRRAVYLWGYGQYFVFASIAATGAGIATAVDHAAGTGVVSETGAGLAVAIPVAVFLLAVWGLESPYRDPISFRTWAIPVAIVAMLAACAFSSQPVLLTGIIVTVLLVAGTAAARWRPLEGPVPGRARPEPDPGTASAGGSDGHAE